MTAYRNKKELLVICIAIALTVILFAAILAGCGEFSRKINGAEASFPAKIKNAKQLSFKMNFKYKKGDSTTEIDMQCYRAQNENGEDEYAYVYSTAASLYDSYKNVYADGKLYEIVNLTKNSGSYYTKEGISVEDSGNILYHITQKIMLTSAAAFTSQAKQETLKGETVYRYDVTINGKKVALWYNSEVLVKIFVSVKNEETEDYEQYTIALSDYHFDEDLPADAFKRPSDYGITYLSSPMSFEDWMGIVTNFAQKLG